MEKQNNIEGIAERALAEIADLLHEANELKSALKLIPDAQAQAMARAELNRRKSHLWLCAVFVWFISCHLPNRTDIIQDTLNKAIDCGEIILDVNTVLNRRMFNH